MWGYPCLIKVSAQLPSKLIRGVFLRHQTPISSKMKIQNQQALLIVSALVAASAAELKSVVKVPGQLFSPYAVVDGHAPNALAYGTYEDSTIQTEGECKSSCPSRTTGKPFPASLRLSRALCLFRARALEHQTFQEGRILWVAFSFSPSPRHLFL